MANIPLPACKIPVTYFRFRYRVVYISELKQRRRRLRLRKRHLKVNARCFKLYRAYSISSNTSSVGNFFFCKGQYQSSGKEKESCCFHVVVVQRRLRNVQISAIHERSCCFAYSSYCCFCRSRSRCRCRCLSSLLYSLNDGFDKYSVTDGYPGSCKCFSAILLETSILCQKA